MLIDTPVIVTPHLACLKTAGITTVIRYLNPLNPKGSKTVQPREATAIAQAGLRLALVNEGWGDFAHGGISGGAGHRDAAYALPAAAALGAKPGPKQSCVYFAVDVDATIAQLNKLVLPYFQSITAYNNAEYHGAWNIGVYGSGAVCRAVHDAGLASKTWLSCSMGWMASRSYSASGKWALRQHVPSKLCGIDVDRDDSQGAIGDFVPHPG